MLRKAGLTTALLLTLPAFAQAWTLSAKIGSGAGSLTSSAVAGKTVTKTASGAPVIGYFKVVDNSTQTISFSPVDGYTLSSVLVDGVKVTPENGTVAVSSGKTNHSMVVYYSAIGANLALTQPASGGSIMVQPLKADGTAFGAISRSGFASLKTGSKVRLTAAPNADYTLTSLTFNGTAQTVLYRGVMGDVPYADVTIAAGNNTATATFTAVPKVTARIAVGEAVTSVNGYAGWNSSQFYKVNQLIPLDVSKTSGTGTISYSFKAYLTDGQTEASGATFTGLTGVQFANAGQYIVKVTADNGATTSTAATPIIRVVSQAAADNASCVGCHTQRNPRVATATATCVSCHGPATNNSHNNGNVTAATEKFSGSRHWNNHFEYGHEFTGGAVEGQINPNESKNTLEDGAATTCSVKCHFKNDTQSGVFGCLSCHSNGLQSNGSFVNANSAHGEPAVTSANTCYSCHSGGKHGATTNNFKKSSHFTGAHAQLYYQMDQKACIACHDPHSTVAAFYTMSGATGLVKKAEGCQSCHKPGSPYSVFDANGAGIAPHFGGADTQFGGSYITTDGATCGDCHGHNNTINAGWAEGGHGDVNAVPWKSDSSHIWNAQGPAANGVNFKKSPQQTNCIRCHSARGFAKFVDSGFTNIDQIKLADGSVSKASAPLTCDGCHSNRKLGETQYSTNEGALRLANFTTAANGAKGYKAMWGYSSASIAKKKIVTQIALLDNRNSNICMPCHSQRASGQEIKDVFAAPAFKQYSAGSAIYPHAAQPAAIWSGKGGYEFTSNSNTATYRDRMNHQRIGNGFKGDKGDGVISYDLKVTTGYNNTGITQGSCVGCHYTADSQYGIGGHSLEAVKFNDFSSALGKTTSARIISNECIKCHPAEFTVADVAAKKADFEAAVAALGNLLVQKGITLDGVNPLPERKAFDMSLGTKDMVKAEKNMGAWFNWYLFNTSDKAAYVHNPAYARRLITDSIDWLDDNTMNGSAPASIIAQSGTKLTAAQVQNATAFAQNPGCMGCHFGTGSTLANGEAVPGVQQAPHFNPAAPAQQDNTVYNAQYVSANAQCNNCHGFGHGTDSPGGTINADWAENHGKVDAKAFAEENFKGNNCNVCHTTTGFIKYATSDHNLNAAAWGTANDASRETVACNACHSSTGWGTGPNHAVRQFNSYSAGMGGMGSNAKYKVSYDKVVNGVDVVKTRSGVCIVCHAGREDSQSIYGGGLLGSAATNFSNSSFKGAHYLPSAGVFYAKSGFKYYTDPTKYTANQRHVSLGMNNYSSVGVISASTMTDPAYASFIGAGTTVGARRVSYSANTGDGGPCVACHMGPAGHTLSPENMINAMPASAAPSLVIPAGTYGCYGCHRTENTKNLIEEVKEEQSAALEYIRLLLESVGVYYNPADNPYFVTSAGADPAVSPVKDWNTLAQRITGNFTSGDKLMGAAHNFKLITSDKGAYVHNHGFTARLLFDTVDFLQNGAVTGYAKLDNTNPVFNAFSTANPGKAGMARNLLTDGKASNVINGTAKARP